MDIDDRARRLAENEAVFRDVNESIGVMAHGLGGEEHLYRFVCECSDVACVKQIELSVQEYEELRGRGHRFAVAIGHDDPIVERVAERRGRYDIVEKFGAGAEVARQLDPRR